MSGYKGKYWGRVALPALIHIKGNTVCVCVCVFTQEGVVSEARVLRKKTYNELKLYNEKILKFNYKNGCVFSLTSSSLLSPPFPPQKHRSKMRLSNRRHTPTLGLFWEKRFFFSSYFLVVAAGAAACLRQDTVTVWSIAAILLVPRSLVLLSSLVSRVKALNDFCVYFSY